ncbi:uncharacterized protein V3H82_005494 isoform 1-T2 [Fundulus diaphanus]
MLDNQNHSMAFTRYMCLFSFLLLDDSDVVQVDNTEEVVVVEKATYTQMGSCLFLSAVILLIRAALMTLTLSRWTTRKRLLSWRMLPTLRWKQRPQRKELQMVAWHKNQQPQRGNKYYLKWRVFSEYLMGPRPKEECVTLSEDLNYLAAKFLPITKISQTCLEEGDGLHEAIAKTENCRKTLGHLLTTMEANWQDYGLATHGLGPQMLKGTFALIDTCLAKKIEILKTQK